MLAAAAIVLAVACVDPNGACAEDRGKTSHKWLNTHFENTEAEIFYGGLLIEASETFTGAVIVVAGALDIQGGGTLNGSAWVIDGEVILSGNARVTGTIDVVNGGVYRSRDATVGGAIRRYDCECTLDTEAFDERNELRFVKHDDPEKVKTKLGVGPGFPKRVNYDILRVGLKRKNNRHREPYVRGHLMVHVPMWGKYYSFVGADLELLIPLFGERSDIIVRGYKQAATTDYWMMPRGETSLNFFVIGKDYPDYFEQRGGQLGLNYRVSSAFRIEPIVTLEENRSLQTQPALSIWQHSSKNRANPEIDEGTRLAVSALVEYDSRGEDKAWPRDAWLAQLWAEKGLNGGPGEFSYTAFFADVRWYNKLTLNFQWDMRARMFSTLDPIPRQASQSLNGFAGVRGAGDQPFPGSTRRSPVLVLE